MSSLTWSARLLAGGALLMAAATAPVATAQGEEKIHELRASPTTVHRAFFDASLKPVLTIESGDIVRLWTTTGNPRYFESLGVPKRKSPPSSTQLLKARRERTGTITRSTVRLPCRAPSRAIQWKSESAPLICGCRSRG